MCITPVLVWDSNVNPVCAHDVEPSKAEKTRNNACDSPGLYEVDVLYFSIFRPLLRFLYPLFLPEIAAGTVCAGGAACLLITKRMTSSVGLFLPNDPSFGNGGRRKEAIWSFTHASSQ